MKAWIVTSRLTYNEGQAYIVFSKTKGKAKSFVLGRDGFEGIPFIDLLVNRLPSADKYYKKGKTHLSWQDPKDRVILAKNYGCVCYEPELAECKVCKANRYCITYQNYRDELL